MKNEKYHSWPHFLIAFLYRTYFRLKISRYFSWSKAQLGEGCTVVIAMASRLPYVLSANLRCLSKCAWPEIKQVIICADTLKGLLPPGFEEELKAQFPKLNIEFAYYNKKQFELAEKAQLPYLFCWLSWLIALDKCRTKHALIQDYDVMVFGDTLEKRYKNFIESGAAIQGIQWYKINGLVPDDMLATTFETYVDVAWVRSFAPIKIFNRVAFWQGRRVDFDCFLDMQANGTPLSKRTIYSMDEKSLIHPTQMIGQYTMARRLKGKPWFCSALTMIPFFYYLSGKNDFLKQVAGRIKGSGYAKTLDFLGNGDLINFFNLTDKEINTMLKLMVQACINLEIEPFADLIEYAQALCGMAGGAKQNRFDGEFTPEQKEWIRQAGLAAK